MATTVQAADTEHGIGRASDGPAESERSIPNNVPLDIRLIEFHVVHHCNLTCVNCAHFSPNVRRQDVSLSSLESDLAAAARSLAPRHVQILGGEPLLNKRLPELVPLFRRYFPAAKINLITNGVLLLKKPLTLFQALHTNQVGIVVSRYPSVQLDLAAIERRCQEFGVGLEYWRQDTFVDFLDPSGSSDPVKARANCPMEGCNNIRDGRIFPCPVAAWADLGGLPYNPADGIALSAPIEEVGAILNPARVTSACAYCRVDADFLPHSMSTRSRDNSGKLYQIDTSCP